MSAAPDGSVPTARLVFDVTADDTARALGSGDVDVLATPRLLAWCEAATCAVAAQESAADGAATTVGTLVRLEHLLPTPVGGQVTVQARLTAVDGRLLHFDVMATDRHGGVLAAGDVSRVVVDRDRFVDRVPLP